MSARTFPTTFVWDHGGNDVHLFISKPNGNETLQLNRSADGTLEVTTELGQGRYEYCFTVDGKWTHDPDLPAIKNENGHYSNMLKIVDPKINFSNKAPKIENLEKVQQEGGIHNFVEKCYSDATINEILERENVNSLSNTLTTSDEHFSEDNSDTDEFPDLDDALEEALDFDHPKFITESPHPARKLVNIVLPSVNTNLNLSYDKIDESILTKNSMNNEITISSVQVKDESKVTNEKQVVFPQIKVEDTKSKDNLSENKSSETKKEMPSNYLTAEENGICNEFKDSINKIEKISQNTIEITEKTKEQKTKEIKKEYSKIDGMINLEKSPVDTKGTYVPSVEIISISNKRDLAQDVSSHIKENRDDLKKEDIKPETDKSDNKIDSQNSANSDNLIHPALEMPNISAKEEFIISSDTTDSVQIVQKDLIKNVVDTTKETITLTDNVVKEDIKIESQTSANCLAKEELTISSDSIHDTKDINTVHIVQADTKPKVHVESENIKETDVDADLEEHEIMQSYEDEISNYYAELELANKGVQKTSIVVKVNEDKVSNLENILDSEPTKLSIVEEISEDELKTVGTSNHFDQVPNKTSEFLFNQTSPISLEGASIEGDVNGNIIDNDTCIKESSDNTAYSSTSKLETTATLHSETFARKSQITEGTNKSLETAVSEIKISNSGHIISSPNVSKEKTTQERIYEKNVVWSKEEEIESDIGTPQHKTEEILSFMTTKVQDLNEKQSEINAIEEKNDETESVKEIVNITKHIETKEADKSDQAEHCVAIKEVNDISMKNVEGFRSNANISDRISDTQKSNINSITEIADVQKNIVDKDKNITITTETQEKIPEIVITVPQLDNYIVQDDAEGEKTMPDIGEKVRDRVSDGLQHTEECEQMEVEKNSSGKDEKHDNITFSEKVEKAPLPNELLISISDDENVLTENEIQSIQETKNTSRLKNDFELEYVSDKEVQDEKIQVLNNETIDKTVHSKEQKNVEKENASQENFVNNDKSLIFEKETPDGKTNENFANDQSVCEKLSRTDHIKTDLIDLSDYKNDLVDNLSKDKTILKISDANNIVNVSEVSNTGDESKYVDVDDTKNIIKDIVNELIYKTDDILIDDPEAKSTDVDSEVVIKIEKAEEESEISQENHLDKVSEKGPKDLFSQVNNTLVSIQKSKSNADLKLNQEIPNQDIPNFESKKDIIESVKDNNSKKIEKKAMNKNLITKPVAGNKEPVVETKSPADEIVETKGTLPVQSPMDQRRQAEREKMERMRMSKKLDEVFGVIRSESVDDIKTEIKVRGMGDVNLKRQVVRKTTVEHNKMDEYEEQKRVARQQISMPEKPATYKKIKPKIEEKSKPLEESPKQVEETPKKEEEKQKPKKKTTFVFITKPQTPPKEPTPQPTKEPTPPPLTKQRTPDLQTKFWPTPKLPTPEPKPEYIDNDVDLIQLSTEKTPPLKIGINGFDRVGRLAFRAAFDAGLEISAVNDPFIPLHYMVYSLKFDMAHNHSKSRRKEITVTESPLGQLIVNGKIVTVFTELDPRKIPWDVAGVNYVIEATESLQSKINARHHLEPDQGAVAMKDISNREEKVLSGDSLKKEQDDSTASQQSEDKKLQKSICNVKKVIIASNSTDFPSFGIGINDERITQSMGVIGNISAQANALILPLKIILDNFGIKYCSYTLLKAIIGPSKDIKCPTLGPATHSKAVKWDFAENLVPAPCPVLEEETLRFIPALRGKLHGIVVYTPVPEVSMFDLTICIEREAEHIYRDICLEMKKQAEGRLKNVMKYVMKMGDETSASCIFTGCPHSVVFDERSGCQIDRSTVKIVLWFDNEYGFANRIVDLVKKAYQINVEQ